jgi:lipopolysaccharide/colanic/teichoic acid biosynthesis glycosyltransferase
MTVTAEFLSDRKVAPEAAGLVLPGAGTVFESGATGQGAKRVFDFLAAASLLVFLAPFLLLISLTIKADSPGPVLFKQRRWGLNGSIIWVYKFRSMRMECADPLATCQTARNDARVTAVGRFIRKTSLDELPQLLNVVRGEMSLVGPRPHALGMTVEGRPNTDAVPTYFQRYRGARPGITGLAQVKGYRGPVDTVEHLSNRVRYDIEYIESWSFWLDLRILALTVVKILNDPNAR